MLKDSDMPIIYREIQCFKCKQRFMWHRLDNIMYEYYLKGAEQELEYAKCPMCGIGMVLIPDNYEGIPEDDERIEKYGIRVL